MPDPAFDNSGRQDRVVESSERLGQFLDRSIAEMKPTPKPNKFIELAAKVAKSQAALNERADALSSRLDKLNEKADEAFARHESAVDQAEHGITQMEEALSGLIGHNGGPND